jgi:hypothetical protein
MVNNIFHFILVNRYGSFKGFLRTYRLSTTQSTIAADALLSQLYIAKSYLVKGVLEFMNIADKVCVILSAHKCSI